MARLTFIKSNTEVVSVLSDKMSHIKYDSAGVIAMLFEVMQSGKDTLLEVKLNVTAEYEQEAIIDVLSVVSRSGSVLFSDVTLKSSQTNYKNVVKETAKKQPSPYISSINSITYTESPTITGADGVDGVDADNSKVLLDVRFDEAVSKGDPLYITGYNNGEDRITVAKADASDSAQMPSIGLAAADGAINTNGQAITIGSLNDVDTSSFSVGDVLYVANGGGLTATKPTGTNLIQNVGKVGRSNANNGEIVVMAIGRSNDLPNLAENKIWKGDSNGVPEQVAAPRTGNLCTLAGRFQFDADDDNRTIIIGNTSFGTNYYLWNTEVWDTVDTGTVDTTTQSISNTYGGLSFKLPVAGKVKWNFNHKPVNSTGYSQNYRAQIWSAASFGASIGATVWTLRADKEFTSGSSTGGWTNDDVTTTSEIASGHSVLFTVGLDDASISAIVYLTMQSTVSLVD